MLILQSKRSYALLLELNPEDDTYRESRRLMVGDVYPKIKINGVFNYLNGVLVALYAISGNLMLRIGNEIIPLNKGVNVLLTRGLTSHVLRVERDGRESVFLEYIPSNDQKINDDPTPFVEDEDFDFGLFVKNIATDHVRQRVVLESW